MKECKQPKWERSKTEIPEMVIIPWTKLFLAKSPPMFVLKLTRTCALSFLSLSLGQFFLIWPHLQSPCWHFEIFSHVSLLAMRAYTIRLLILIHFPLWIRILLVIILIILSCNRPAMLQLKFPLLFLILYFLFGGSILFSKNFLSSTCNSYCLCKISTRSLTCNTILECSKPEPKRTY